MIVALSGLTALKMLDVSGGSISQIPTNIGKLSALTALRMSNSKLSSTIPSDISKLTRLLSLDVSNNAISGTLPTDLWALPYLKSMDLSGNANIG